MKTLLHICCANCALYPITTMRQRGIVVEGLWFNPNIHPLTEYTARLNALKTLQSAWNLQIHYNNLYGLVDFIRNVVNKEDNRCLYCYTVRLQETAQKARQDGYNAFSTTLLYSIYQRYDTIVEIGKLMQVNYDVEFYVEDFRKGWREGIGMSKALSLYRQKYCGCIYSEMERYRKNDPDIVVSGI
ncbi:MAG: epoxyqueuosine reductase QueH [Nitrospirae bacterium]|nr:epoxyqueuosine reductase QueH [Nitrospirota bacterium]